MALSILSKKSRGVRFYPARGKTGKLELKLKFGMSMVVRIQKSFGLSQ